MKSSRNIGFEKKRKESSKDESSKDESRKENLINSPLFAGTLETTSTM